jgi:hypothetical protein
LYKSASTARVVKSGRLRWAVHVARIKEEEISTVLVGKCAVKRPHENRDGHWVDNIKMDLTEIESACGSDYR